MASHRLKPLYRLERISTGGKVEAINNYRSKTEAERDARAFRRYIKAAPLGNVWKYRVRRLTTEQAATSENPGPSAIPDRHALLDTLKHLNWVFGKGEIQSIEWTPDSSTGGARVKLQYGGQFVKFTIDPTGKYVTFRGHRRKIAAQNPGPSAIPARWTPATVSHKGGQIQIQMGGR